MKILLKRIIYSILIIFTIISVTSLIYNYYIIKNTLHNTYSDINTGGVHQESINLQDNMSINQLLKINYYNGMLNILDQFLFILLISVLGGIILGSIFSIKDSSIAQYILSYILGNLLYNSLAGIIIQGICLRNEIELTFFEAYFQSFTKTIIIYSIIFIIFVIVKSIVKKKKSTTFTKKM